MQQAKVVSERNVLTSMTTHTGGQVMYEALFFFFPLEYLKDVNIFENRLI